MKNNSVQTTVVLGFSAQLLSDFYHMEFFDKNGVRTGGSARLRRHAAEKGSQPQAATPSSDLEVLKL
ncbi:MAG: hypothetical protein II615_06425, partial [Ruminococcus sp.]|nr:hypothetical protein [Ruminococcus sp.]